MEISIDDCHIWKKLIVSKRILNACLFVSNNCEWCYFRACTCGCGNCDKVCLFTHLGEGINSLTDIDKAHCHIHKVSFGMLIENPHNLCRVHSRTTTERDDCIGSEGSHLRCALSCICKCWVGLNVKECCVLNTHCVKLVCNGLCVTVLIKECIGYDKRLFSAANCFKLVKCYGEATLLYINLFRCSEPKHIFSPLSNCFNIEQVLNANVFGN